MSPSTPVTDVHAHVFPLELPSFTDAGDDRWPVLVPGPDAGQIMRGNSIFRTVQPSLWDLPTRLAELDVAGIHTQVISPVPVTLTYWAPPREATEFARCMNDGIAQNVGAAAGRIVGLGTVPLQDVDAAVAELERLIVDLKLLGVEIGTVIGDRELDDPALRPFFAAAERLGAILFVHPMDGGSGIIRRSGEIYDFGIGMLTDTAIAATALVFGGVLEAYPRLQVVLAHGCGSYPWVYPRLRLRAQVSGADPEDLDALTRKLWVDALVFNPANIPLLVDRFGADHVMVGTDHPFVPGQLTAAPSVIRSAADLELISTDVASGILVHNADYLLHRC